MRLFKNENYTDFYTEPPTLGLDDVLYVEVNMERPLLTDIDSSSNVSDFLLQKLYLEANSNSKTFSRILSL